MAHVPRTIEVELTRDLVESCFAGDVVTVLGLVKVMSTDSKRGVKSLVSLKNNIEKQRLHVRRKEDSNVMLFS